ncbi:MAG TPA: FliM/FliN family flagellar motor switch protein [Polyangiaceae bacterium]|jgi:type III secretion system YscQ/HrcQ family protein|nr:FliM/FliN family flagellar motor switch protein [Polyangiaceae bacterium]
MAAVHEYPWHALERLSRRSVRGLRRARDLIRPGQKLEAVLGELAGTQVEIIVRHLGRSRAPSAAREIVLQLGNSPAHLGVTLEPDGVQVMLARALGRPLSLIRPDAELGSTLSGAAAALAIEVARRLLSAPVRLATAPAEGDPVELEATVLIEGRPFAASLRAWVDGAEPAPSCGLAVLGDMPLALPLVVAVSATERAELEALELGDAWFPGRGWWIDRSLAGHAALAAPHSERGIGVELTPAGAVVLRGGALDLSMEVPPTPEEEAAMSGNDDEPEALLAEVVLEAPVVVRVELGTVSLTAAEVAEMRAGDVIETGRRLAEPVVLRVAGRAIARGDLVDVEGELGVRIRELVGRET